MAVVIQGNRYLRTREALKRAGISRATFFRWLKNGAISDTFRKDRRGWRLFAENDILRIRQEAEKTYIGSQSRGKHANNLPEAK